MKMKTRLAFMSALLVFAQARAGDDGEGEWKVVGRPTITLTFKSRDQYSISYPDGIQRNTRVRLEIRGAENVLVPDCLKYREELECFYDDEKFYNYAIESVRSKFPRLYISRPSPVVDFVWRAVPSLSEISSYVLDPNNPYSVLDPDTWWYRRLLPFPSRGQVFT